MFGIKSKKTLAEELFAKNGCKITKELGELFLDEVQQRWAIKGGDILYHYSDIIDFDVSEVGGAFKKNGRKLTETFSSLSVNIYTRHPQKPCVMIELITPNTPKDSALYRLGRLNADLLIGWLTQITATSKSQPSATASAADEIAKYKNLLDSGAITEEEYNAKKSQLLGI